MNQEIWLVGTGQRFPGHLSVEALDALYASDLIFTLLDDEQIQLLPPKIARRCRSVRPSYRDGRHRSENYSEVAQSIIAEVQSGVQRVAWLTLGNPRVLDSVSEALIRFAKTRRGVHTVVLPAVSSIDSVLIDVDFEPARGILVVEATTLRLMQVRLVPELATLIMQPGTFGTLFPRLTAASTEVDLSELEHYLLAYFPSSHPAAFVLSSHSCLVSADVAWTTVNTLQEAPLQLRRSGSIFIPPVGEGKLDEAFLSRMKTATE